MINSEGAQTNKELSPGKRLLQGRLDLGLTQEQVAKELYITLAKIKALESDDYRRLTSDTFIRGYIRAYANLLKLDVVEILAAYDQLTQEADAESEAAVNAKAEPPIAARPTKSALHYLLVIGGCLLGLWLISIWFFDGRKETNYSTVLPVESSVAVSNDVAFESSVAISSVESGVFAVGSSKTQSSVFASSSIAKAASSVGASKARASSSSRASTTNANATNNVRNQSSSSVALSSDAASSVAVSSVRAAQVNKSNTLDTISFTFRAECWLEVSDSRGDVLATELQGAGSKLTLVGKAPFDVKLGNAPGVDIQLNSKKIDVIPLLGSNVLTLRVGN